jgi:glycosyltransferase involved in cell wall biosynthesis
MAVPERKRVTETRSSDLQNLFFTIAVCTYNRGPDLRRCVAALCRQRLDPALFEVLVVDNNSTDDTAEVAAHFMGGPVRVRYVFERRQGLSRARNTAWEQAFGQVIGYIDDDAVAERDWLQHAYRCMTAVKPTPMAMGGPIVNVYTGGRPSWLKTYTQVWSLGDADRPVDRDVSFFGGNMFFLRQALESIGGFSESLGMNGDVLSLGEENDLMRRLWLHYGPGMTAYYCSRLAVHHFVGPERSTISYQLKRSFSGGQAVQGHEIARTGRRDTADCARAILKVLRSTGWALKNFHASPIQSWVVEFGCPTARQAGAAAAHLGVGLRVRGRSRMS